MRSIFFIFTGLIFCGNIFSQDTPIDPVLKYIYSDISKYSGNAIHDHAVPSRIPPKLQAFFEKSIPLSPGSYQKNTNTVIREGYAGQEYYTILATIFSPEIVSKTEIYKEVIFLDFPGTQVGYEIRVYQILSDKASVEQRIFWKKTSENSYCYLHVRD